MKQPSFGYNKEQSFMVFETTEGKAVFGKEDNRIFIEVLGIKTYLTNPNGNTDYYNDMLGKVQSAQVGGTAWDIEAMTGTSFVIGALKNNSTDLVQVTIQSPHGRKIGSVLASIHFHYILQAASLLNQTIVFTGKYAWQNPGEAFPEEANWTAFTSPGLTLNLGAVKPVRYYGIHSIQIDVPAPANEGYGGMLLVNITRGNGTYTGKMGILDVDAHSIFSKPGSIFETSD